MVMVSVMVAGVKVVAAEMPEVKGASCTGVALVKAGACDAAVPSGTASAAWGLSTLCSNVNGVEMTVCGDGLTCQGRGSPRCL